MLNVQYADSTEAAIVSYFGCPQPSSCPSQGVVAASDTRWATFYNSLPLQAQQNLPPPTA